MGLLHLVRRRNHLVGLTRVLCPLTSGVFHLALVSAMLASQMCVAQVDVSIVSHFSKQDTYFSKQDT